MKVVGSLGAVCLRFAALLRSFVRAYRVAQSVVTSSVPRALSTLFRMLMEIVATQQFAAAVTQDLASQVWKGVHVKRVQSRSRSCHGASRAGERNQRPNASRCTASC